MKDRFRLGIVLCCVCIVLPVTADEGISQDVIEAFKAKVCLNPMTFSGDPYLDKTFDSTPPPQASVCAVQYEADHVRYTLQTFADKQAALAAGFMVTHQGKCGTCSTLQDLATYLDHTDLTTPVRKCSSKLLFPRWSMSCLRDLGFSEPCAQTWFYNAKNTSRDCLWVCLKSWMKNEPFTNEDGELNDCLACDEEKSGPVFKAVAGRTRRNSGIRSAIDRDEAEIYPIVHDYF